MIVGVNHFTVTAKNPEETLAFYTQLIGLEEGARPNLGFPGAWLYADGKAILHLYFDRELPANAAGAVDHVALTARGLRDVKARFDAKQVPYELRQQRGAGTWQLFCNDPNGAKIELDFDASESA